MKIIQDIFLAGLILLAGCSKKTSTDDSLIYSKDFKETLNYIDTVAFYSSFFEMTDPLFNPAKKDLHWTYDTLGKTKTLLIYRNGNTYVVKFPESDYCCYLKRNENGQWIKSKYQDGREILVENHYEYKQPENFIEAGSKFGPNSKNIINQLKYALEYITENTPEAPSGTNHFFIQPFDESKFAEAKDAINYIYWKETKSIIFIDSGNRGGDPGKWNFSDLKIIPLNFREYTLIYPSAPFGSDEFNTEMEKGILCRRIFFSNTEIANCVRDGIMITICKKNPITHPLPPSK